MAESEKEERKKKKWINNTNTGSNQSFASNLRRLDPVWDTENETKWYLRTSAVPTKPEEKVSIFVASSFAYPISILPFFFVTSCASFVDRCNGFSCRSSCRHREWRAFHLIKTAFDFNGFWRRKMRIQITFQTLSANRADHQHVPGKLTQRPSVSSQWRQFHFSILFFEILSWNSFTKLCFFRRSSFLVSPRLNVYRDLFLNAI